MALPPPRRSLQSVANVTAPVGESLGIGGGGLITGGPKTIIGGGVIGAGGDVVHTLTGWSDAVVAAAEFLIDPSHWFRVAEFLAGVAAVGVGIIVVTWDTRAGEAVREVAGQTAGAAAKAAVVA